MRSVIRVALLLSLWGGLDSCMGRRYLKGDQKLLVDQNLEGAQKLNKEEIESLYAYEPNEKILFIPWSPYVDLYQLGKKSYDSSKYENKKIKLRKKYNKKIARAQEKDRENRERKLKQKLAKKINKQNKNLKEGNQAMRLGEPLAIYDTALENETVEKIEKYLHAKGYFNAEVSRDTEETIKLVTSTYTIDRKEAYLLDSIFYRAPDSLVLKILQKEDANSLLIKGENYDQDIISKERERINDIMLNNGYYDFNRKLIGFRVDTTTLGDRKVMVGIVVNNPPDRDSHKIFRLDSVIFNTDADITGLSQKRSHKTYNGVTYQFHQRRYNEKILDWRLFLQPDSLYSKANTLETQKQLSNMDIFKFINVNYDTTGGQFIANVFTSPLKKYQTSTEAGLSVSQGLPGPFLNMSVKNRNIFKGLEVAELSGRVGFEGLTGATETGNPYSSLDYGANLSLTFPQFVMPLGKNIKSNLGRFNPKTKILFGLNFNSRTEYLRNNINAVWAYTWQNYNKRRSYTVNMIDVNYINSDITDPAYRELLENLEAQGNNLIRSFEPSFISGSSLTAIYNINEYGNKTSRASFLRYQIETGGNFIQSFPYTDIDSDNKLEFFKFAKLDVDFRQTLPVNSIITLAYRAHAGVAIPYGDNKTLPYEKFFFAGGSNSIRAWEPRRLGPGTYLPLDSAGNYSNNFEQPAEIILELSAEFRHQLFGPIHGAFFIDAGNSWTFNESDDRPGANFESDFLSEIAVGGGYGVRVDFSFLILRLDAAWKLIDPASTSRFSDNNRSSVFDLPDYEGYNRLIWNIGIGYPF
ncbi:translocation and assembly module lipoprotein TamL [Reichenbachiella ulvae]|uniref:BamA/TamA family outer membrane protein n=1 Tax=Reichenbachiella ulvae TaxID=2980104 RepID=A0ABT3CTJ8_9BACT|nr:BamA/TamA family outer membrane protein [Reichenbachiella ulvae]MCV9386911.1 BamA/TamA family outer membrane protein [Reichenbachiella ulvae]